MDLTARQVATIGGLMLLAGLSAAVMLGPAHVPMRGIAAVLADALGFAPLPAAHVRDAAILTVIRLPRALLAAMVGAGLAVAGVVMQGLFRNPLADPGLIGVSAGSALAAVTMLVFGGGVIRAAGAWGVWLLPLAAFGGGLVATFLVARIAAREGGIAVATLLLAGIAVNALANAGIGLLLFIADDRQLRDITFWMLGSLAGARWAHIPVLATLVLLPAAALVWLAAPLNALAFGEREAFHLGIPVERVKRIALVLAAIAVSAGVAFTGLIAFVGLVVPHLVRLSVGPDHRLVLPLSAFGGAALLLVADLGARSLAAPAELPIGVLTSLLGAPFFLWLLRREETA
jgi:iron complex transport system permease protein